MENSESGLEHQTPEPKFLQSVKMVGSGGEEWGRIDMFDPGARVLRVMRYRDNTLSEPISFDRLRGFQFGHSKPHGGMPYWQIPLNQLKFR